MTLLEKIYLWLRNLFSKPQERGESSAGYWQGKIRNNILNLSASYKGRILELGCGEGLFLAHFLKKNPAAEIYGIDSMKGSLCKARQRLREENLRHAKLVNSKADMLPFRGASFDGLICVNVLICVDSPQVVKAIIREMGRVIKPGGRAVIEFRNKRNPFLWVKYKLAKYYDSTIAEQGHPLSTYFREDMLRFLNEEGFCVIKEKAIDGFMIRALAPIFIIEAQKT